MNLYEQRCITSRKIVEQQIKDQCCNYANFCRFEIDKSACKTNVILKNSKKYAFTFYASVEGYIANPTNGLTERDITYIRGYVEKKSGNIFCTRSNVELIDEIFNNLTDDQKIYATANNDHTLYVDSILFKEPNTDEENGILNAKCNKYLIDRSVETCTTLANKLGLDIGKNEYGTSPINRCVLKDGISLALTFIGDYHTLEFYINITNNGEIYAALSRKY